MDRDVHVAPVYPMVFGRLLILQVQQPEPEILGNDFPGVEDVPHFLLVFLVLLGQVEDPAEVVSILIYDQVEIRIIHGDPAEMKPFFLEQALERECGYQRLYAGEGVDGFSGGEYRRFVIQDCDIPEGYGAERLKMDPGEFYPAIQFLFQGGDDLPGDEGLDSGSLEEKP